MSTTTLAPAWPIPAGTGQPAPKPVQEQVSRLRKCGESYRGIAAAAGLSPATVWNLVSGRRPATPYTTTALLAVISQTGPCYRVDAGGTRLRLRALHVMGHGSARVARAVGVDPETICKLVRGDTTTISPQLRDAIIAIYDAWWDKRAPARTPLERGAATKARKRAIAGDWCAAAALDDDLLDTPGYRPRWGWKPATGTGTAPDIEPSALQSKKEGHVPDDKRFTWGFILEVLDVMERHGYRPSDNQHTGQALGLIRDVAHIYEGTLDAPRGGYVVVPSPEPAEPQPPGQAAQPAAALSASQVTTIAAALGEAYLYRQDQVATCADCADRSCAMCKWRLQEAHTYVSLANQLAATTHASTAATTSQPQPGADLEAGQ